LHKLLARQLQAADRKDDGIDIDALLAIAIKPMRIGSRQSG
jgi:hypothetical protein